ncbi:MAG TPA: ribosome recycling factor [Ktedonobacterales bacterium]|jgi:ribosome recycling factor|nr:ribosome recycling factor [Ktedonobacterales bacterium]
MADDVFVDVEHRMTGAVDALRRELQTIRTGRASPALVERLAIEYYGAPTPLQSVATIHATDARTLTIQPYDRKTLADIEKAIQKSDLGLNPNNDGTAIRLVIPPLTEERRKELVKVVHKKVDEGKVAVRNCRRDGDHRLKEQEKAKEISADELKRGGDRMQKLTDRFIDEMDKVGRAKEAEISAV